MRRAEVAQAMAVVSAYWPGVSFGPDLDAAVAAWERLLVDVDPAAVLAAIEDHAASGDRFAPLVGQVRRRALEITAAARGEQVPDVDEAWRMVLDRIERAGFSAGPDPDWPGCVAQTVRAVGWRRLCYDDNPGTLLAQFRDMYRPAAVRQTQEAIMPASTKELIAGLAGVLEGRRRELDA